MVDIFDSLDRNYHFVINRKVRIKKYENNAWHEVGTVAQNTVNYGEDILRDTEYLYYVRSNTFYEISHDNGHFFFKINDDFSKEASILDLLEPVETEKFNEALHTRDKTESLQQTQQVSY